MDNYDNKQHWVDEEKYSTLPTPKQDEARMELIKAARPVCDWLRKYGGDFAYITDDFVKVAYNLTSNMIPKEFDNGQSNNNQ